MGLKLRLMQGTWYRDNAVVEACTKNIAILEHIRFLSDGKPLDLKTLSIAGNVSVEEKVIPTEVELIADVITIGRSRENDIVLDDSSVSRVHCKIVHKKTGWFSSGWFITDVGSSKGTLLYKRSNPKNVVKVHETPNIEYVLEKSDMLQLGAGTRLYIL